MGSIPIKDDLEFRGQFFHSVGRWVKHPMVSVGFYSLSIPIMKDDQSLKACEPANLRASGMAEQPRRILVVEDDAGIRGFNVEVLVRCGFEVSAAEDGAAAWEDLQIHRYDLMLTDNNMPRVSGVDLLKKLHAAQLELPVIMATGISPEDEFARCPWLRPEALLLKPYTIEQLLGTVKKVLRTSTVIRAQIEIPPEQSGNGGLRV